MITKLYLRNKSKFNEKRLRRIDILRHFLSKDEIIEFLRAAGDGEAGKTSVARALALLPYFQPHEIALDGMALFKLI